MPFEVRLSQIQDRAQFEQAVADHVERLLAFNKEVGKPRPVTHPLVEACVKRVAHPKNSKLPDDYMADYLIVDDTPPPPAPLSLEDHKRVFHAQLAIAENAAKHKVLPQRKHRLMVMNVNAAAAKIKLIDGIANEDALSAEEKSVIADYQVMQKRYAEIELAAATAEAAIEDLTEDTVDSWQLPELG